MFDRFTDRARKIMGLARREATRFQHDDIRPEHILLGLIDEGAGVGSTILRSLGADLLTVRKEIETRIRRGRAAQLHGQRPFSKRAKQVLTLAVEESVTRGETYIGSQHLLLGVVRAGQSIASDVLEEADVDLARARAACEKVDPVGPPVAEVAEGAEPAGVGKDPGEGRAAAVSRVETSYVPHLTDLTRFASDERLPPVVGRHREVSDILRVFQLFRPRAALLYGEAGAGKTAVVYRVARQLAQCEVPNGFTACTLYQLDLGAFLASSEPPGGDNHTLIHTVRAARSSPSDILAVDLRPVPRTLLPWARALLRELTQSGTRMIVLASTERAHTWLAADAQALRYLRPIPVEPLDAEQTLVVLLAWRRRLESHHRVSYAPGALERIVEVARDRMPGCVLPDTAIRLMDEAGARHARGAEMALMKRMSAIKDRIEALQGNAAGDAQQIEALQRQFGAVLDELSSAPSPEATPIDETGVDEALHDMLRAEACAQGRTTDATDVSPPSAS